MSSEVSDTKILQQLIAELKDPLIQFRRDIHANPELSWKEIRTTARIQDRLIAEGLRPVLLPETSGLYVDVGAGEHAAAFRADIDALPLTESTGLPYTSTEDGVAHACGHDIHTTVMLGVALSLQRLHQQKINDGDPRGLGATVRVIFQPAEETLPGGAQEVVRHQLLDPVPRVFALHCDPKHTVGSVGTRIGAITSATDVVRIELTGRGGHTSRPHLSHDLVGALSHLALTVPAVLSRRTDVRSAVSLVWGQIQAGSAPNAIPSTGILRGTMRVLDAETWEHAGSLLEEIIDQAAKPYGVDTEVDHVRGAPPVVNAEAETMMIENAARDVLGPDSVILAEQSMGGEDFAWMTRAAAGAMFRLGTKTPGGPEYDLHRGDYNPDEGAIDVGVRVMAAVASQAVAEVRHT